MSFAEQLSAACADYAVKYNYKSTDLGRGFEAFIVHLSAADGNFLTSPEVASDPMQANLGDNIFRINEGGVDGYLEDETNKIIMLIQSKYKKDVNEDELKSFLNIPDILFSPQSNDYLEKLDPRVRAVLAPLKERVQTDNWTIVLRFATGRPPAEKEKLLVQAADADYRHRKLRVNCEIIGQENIKAIWEEVVTGMGGLNEPVKIAFKQGNYLAFSTPRPTILGTVSGNELANLYKRYRNLLFAQNIRLPMLSSGRINPDIAKTAKENPSDFFYYNNGVSAICTSFEEKNGTIEAWDFQIINGAQTVGTLGEALSLSSDVKVLFRLTTADKDAASFRDEITRTNNTQNEVVPWDFRANDAIQKWLQTTLPQYSGNGSVPTFWYKRKRGSTSGGKGGRALEPEYLGKLRHAYRHGPILSYKEPKRLASTADDTGLYYYAFGINGERADVWPKGLVDEAMFAYALDDYITKKADAYKKSGHDYGQWLKRLSRFIVGVIGELAPSLKIDPKTYVTLPLEEFSNRVDPVLKPIMDKINDHYQALKPKRVQPEYDIARDQEYFELLCKNVRAALTA